MSFTRDELITRLNRAGELEVSGADPVEQASYFDTEKFRWHGPDGAMADYDGLAELFAGFREAFDDRSIRRGILLAEGNLMACQTWIEGTFAREYRDSPAGRPLAPTGARLVWAIINIFQFDEYGRLVEEWVQYDNRNLLRQLGAIDSTGLDAAQPESVG
ncbi:ester cyclase [Cryptosporangium phraense]|uniref:Ester cyclase n=1 Tax=Cryptosporangium phraense TaxID=2593070 RepID=A0A545AVG6_9ACTN|nr:ester cyclase [Cryptosporangium phraense]TQS45329.1 ester cyclase [Cryptosporangium phraense]